MASINQRNGKIFFDFRWQGRRHREYCDVPDTPDNRKRAEAALKQITLSIKRGDFILEDYSRYQCNEPSPPMLLVRQGPSG